MSCSIWLEMDTNLTFWLCDCYNLNSKILLLQKLLYTV